MDRLAILLLLSLVVAQPVAAELTVSFLANEGFLIGDSIRSVVIDGFVTRPHSKYGAVDASVWERMLAREAPFDNVVLALVSHVHRDHFQPRAAMAFLLAHPETTLVSSPDVRKALESEPAFDRVSERVKSLEPAWGERLAWEIEGLRVEFLHLPHGGIPWSEIHNIGHVVELDGKSVLHIGDAQQDSQPYEAVDLSKTVFDVALIPYWMYSSSDGRELRSNYLRAKTEIAVHVPPREVKEVREAMAKSYPEVQLLSVALDSARIE
jgi:L-ascorbate metabolism protein UlaG (beta-lactamase superfamily)